MKSISLIIIPETLNSKRETKEGVTKKFGRCVGYLTYIDSFDKCVAARTVGKRKGLAGLSQAYKAVAPARIPNNGQFPLSSNSLLGVRSHRSHAKFVSTLQPSLGLPLTILGMEKSGVNCGVILMNVASRFHTENMLLFGACTQGR
jgi:hypothetical protein